MNHSSRERIYVKVNSDFDATGYVQPRSIVWADGRVFQIEQVRDFRPAAMTGGGPESDCYTVIIQGEEKHLFFERLSPMFASRVGRWFVEGKGGINAG